MPCPGINGSDCIHTLMLEAKSGRASHFLRHVNAQTRRVAQPVRGDGESRNETATLRPPFRGCTDAVSGSFRARVTHRIKRSSTAC
jgi:hypothetical protein